MPNKMSGRMSNYICQKECHMKSEIEWVLDEMSEYLSNDGQNARKKKSDRVSNKMAECM